MTTLQDIKDKYDSCVKEWILQLDREGMGDEDLDKATKYHCGDPDFVVRKYEMFRDDLSTSEDWPVMKAMKEMFLQAKLYTIARDQGLQAAMLWKLSNP